MSYGLKDETVEKINSILARSPEVDEAILYGSRAKGNFRPGSDIDLTLKGKGLNLHLLNTISLALDDLLLPYHVDLSIFHQIDNPDLIAHIERVGRIFYHK
ncbi:MAG: nucleotidyltransferase domain-containing protein [Thermodesulfobacteriota bacterium]